MREHPPQSPQSCISVSRTARKQQSIAIAVFDSIQFLIAKPRSRKQVPAVAVVLPTLFFERLRVVHPIDKLHGELFESNHRLSRTPLIPTATSGGSGICSLFG